MGTVFCGVFDGHGPLGHMVAKKVRNSLPVKLKAHWDVITRNDDSRENTINTVRSMNSEETASICLNEEPRASTDSEEKEKDPEFFKILKKSFLKAFKVMDKELRVHPNIDCFCSGTTAVTLVKQVLFYSLLHLLTAYVSLITRALLRCRIYSNYLLTPLVRYLVHARKTTLGITKSGIQNEE